ncbi:MAG: hypothetical protein ACJAYG_001259 [Oceanicoccus sp.]|jgi:hypothetical protein
MKLVIHSKDVESEPDLSTYIEYRMGFAFARTRRLIKAVVIAITDINGPKGGVDKQCKVIIKSYGLSDIVITERQSEIKSAIDRGITRASRNFVQQMKRKGILKSRHISHRSLPLMPEYS